MSPKRRAQVALEALGAGLAEPAGPDPRRMVPPRTRRHLAQYCREFFRIEVPDKALCPGHVSPLDYLWHAVHADWLPAGRKPQTDAIVWANRAGGKTHLAALATALDAVLKPGCEIRLLGGSGEQSRRAYRYVVALLYAGFVDLLEGEVLKSGCRLANGSTIEIMTQSQTSVRGQHIQKLRCDEVELFDPDILAAAKLTTQSKGPIRPAMELLSTMHRPYGLMHSEVTDARERHVPVFQWCVWETIERCKGRSCSQCPLNSDCQGRAKKARGYLRIDDVIQQMRRTSRPTWESEMLCLKPSLEGVVFAEFDPNEHVRPVEFVAGLPLYRAIDFGFVNPFVCLWLQRRPDGAVNVIQEYVRSRVTVGMHARAVKGAFGVREEEIAGTYCDPAGAASEGINGTTQIAELATFGIVCMYRRSNILDGIELIRKALRNAEGKPALFIHPRCVRLIEALQGYRYPENSRCPSELPLKDGVHDHPIDALRYFFVNSESKPTSVRRY